MQFIDGLVEPEIWNIGNLVGKERGKNVLARADLSKMTLLDIGLAVSLSPGVHPLHADVSRWPLDKGEQKAIALELCAKSRLLFCPTAS